MVSLGSGDIELITIKALRALKKCDAILIPTKSKDKSFHRSITHKMIRNIEDEFNFRKKLIPVYSPMEFKKADWENEVDTIIKSLEQNDTVCFVTLGDAAIYSSVYYLLDIIEEKYPSIYQQTTVIPGITSFSNGSAKVKKPLCIGDSGLQIVPLLDKDVPNTTIYMRPKVGMNTKNIQEQGHIYTFENLDLIDSKIFSSKKNKVEKYMTLFVDFVK